jgi:excisionase family DNA binding protein
MKKEETHSTLVTTEEELLTPEELMAKLKLPSKNWLYQHVHAGTLPFPFVKIGRYLRFPAAAIQKYIESQTRGGSAA